MSAVGIFHPGTAQTGFFSSETSETGFSSSGKAQNGFFSRNTMPFVGFSSPVTSKLAFLRIARRYMYPQKLILWNRFLISELE